MRKCKLVDNYKMSREVRIKRRKVINLLYEAKRSGVKFDHIDVRIGKPANPREDSELLGVATMKGKEMWIVESALELGNDWLRLVVFHELGHALFGLEHDEKCPLMKATHNTTQPAISKEDCVKHLLKYQDR